MDKVCISSQLEILLNELSITAYPFPWGRGVLLLEPIPALSQGKTEREKKTLFPKVVQDTYTAELSTS